MRTQATTWLCAMFSGVFLFSAQAGESPQRPHTFSKEIVQTVTLDYLLYLPEGYEAEANTAWPLILFLHGSGERGHDVEAVKRNGLPLNLEEGTNLPFIVVSPQCPKDTDWSDSLIVEVLSALLDQLISTYRIDQDRIYLTGLSMGGSGTWALGTRYPERFAALAPVCGRGNAESAVQLRRLPIWVFHGALDDIVEPEESKLMVDAIKRADGEISFTLYSNANHNSWTATYNNPELYAWLLRHTRRPKPAFVPLNSATVTASSGDASKAIDGDFGTRWESEWSDPQWIQIDLGEPAGFRQLILTWETAYAKSYELFISDNGTDWATVFSQENGDGVVDAIPLPAESRPRYLKLICKERGTEWGHSLWEVELEK